MLPKTCHCFSTSNNQLCTKYQTSAGFHQPLTPISMSARNHESAGLQSFPTESAERESEHEKFAKMDTALNSRETFNS